MDLAIFPIALLFVFSALFGSSFSILSGVYIKNSVKKNSDIYLIYGFIFLVGTLINLAFSAFNIKISLFTVLCGVIYGSINMIYNFTRGVCVKIGPFGFTTVIINLSTGLTALSGAIFWNETLTPFKIVGIVLILVCFFLASDKGGDKKKANTKWLLLALCCLAFCTTIGLTQKTHQSNENYCDETYAFVIVAFLTSAVLSFIFSIFLSKKDKNETYKGKRIKLDLRFWIYMLLIGLSASVINIVNLYLAGAVDSSICFPIVNGAPLCASLVFSFLFFKEKLTVKQFIGLGVGIIAIVFLVI